MTMTIRACALAAGLSALVASASAAAAPDAFAQACVARGKSTPDHCACQSKLARAALTQREQAAMIRAMRGEADGFRAAIAAMGDGPGQAFIGKMQKLQARSEAQCR